MKHFALLTALFCALFSLSGAELCGQRTEELSNPYVQATIVPGTMGCIAQLRWLPGKCDLFLPYQYDRIVVNELLPAQENVSLWGNRTLIFDALALFYQKFSVDERTGDSVTMSGKFIGGRPVLMTRKIALEKDAALFRTTITLKNLDAAAQEFRLWEHMVPNPGGRTPDVSMLCGEGVRRIGRYQDTEKHTSGLLCDTFADHSQSRYIVPGGNWIAATSAEQTVTVFLRTPLEFLEKNGCFYTYKAAANRIHTVELLFSPITLKRGESRTVTLELGVLSGLKTLKRLEGDIGFDFERKGNELLWRASVLRPLAARKVRVSAGGWSGEISLPALIPGKCAEGKLSGVPELPENAFFFHAGQGGL